MDRSISIVALMLFTVLISFTTVAQLLDTNTVWSDRGTKYSYVADDTVTINNNLYHYLNTYSDTAISYSNSTGQTFLLREEGDSIFWKEEFGNDEYLLYDFSLAVNDSIYVTPMSNSSSDSVLLRCENVDTVGVMGIQRRRLTMRTLNPDPYYGTDLEYWYWGIGSDLGVLKAGYLGIPIMLDEYAPMLYCCHKSFTQVYQNSMVNACHSTLSIEDYLLGEQISIYPNPIKRGESLIIQENPVKSDQILILDASGKEIKSVDLRSDKKLIIGGDFEPGIYFLQMSDGQRILHRKKLVVQ